MQFGFEVSAGLLGDVEMLQDVGQRLFLQGCETAITGIIPNGCHVRKTQLPRISGRCALSRLQQKSVVFHTIDGAVQAFLSRFCPLGRAGHGFPAVFQRVPG